MASLQDSIVSVRTHRSAKPIKTLFLTSAKPIREWSVKTVLIFIALAIHIESWTNADIDE